MFKIKKKEAVQVNLEFIANSKLKFMNYLGEIEKFVISSNKYNMGLGWMIDYSVSGTSFPFGFGDFQLRIVLNKTSGDIWWNPTENVFMRKTRLNFISD